MDSKFLFINFLFFSSWVIAGFSEEVGDDQDVPQNLLGLGVEAGLDGIAQGKQGDAMPCMQKLLPCKPYLKSSSPPSSCCVPLKETISNYAQCLCNVFNNPDILKSLNVTHDEALNLPKACGADADISKCKDATTSPTTPPGTPSSRPGSGSGSSSNNTASAANGIHQIQFAEFGFISFLVTLGFMA